MVSKTQGPQSPSRKIEAILQTHHHRGCSKELAEESEDEWSGEGDCSSGSSGFCFSDNLPFGTQLYFDRKSTPTSILDI